MDDQPSIFSRRSLSRRQACALGAAALFAPWSRHASAAGYPERPVMMVVPFAAGGSADVYARLLAPPLEAEFGQPFLVDDRPGTAAILGTRHVQTSPADGYTLLVISNTHTVNETLYPTRPYKLLEDFTPVAPINSSDLVLVTRPSLGANTIADIVAMAKEKPGKLTYASSGAGTPYHMAGELFKQMAGVDILHVAYKGSSPARMDVISAQIDMMFDATTTMTGFIANGQVKGLGTTGTSRSSALPALPTIAETVPGYTATIWLGVVAPKKTPPEVVARLSAAISKIAQKPDVVAGWQQQGAVPMIMDQGQFAEYIARDIVKWEKVVKTAGITIQ